jgi:hypothetical protein
MPRFAAHALAVLLGLAFANTAFAQTPPKKKHHVTHHVTRPITKHWHGYGFLPGYRSPEQIQAARDRLYWESGPHYYGPAWPRFYRGRWNGGGFGPCYTQTPIGPMWNCGR